MPFVTRWRWRNGMRRTLPSAMSTALLSRRCQLPGCPGHVPLPPPVQPDEVTEEVRRFFAPSLSDSGQSVEIVVREGHAAKEIVLLAEQLPADLLVLGTHGRSGFERLFLGSVTEKCFAQRTLRS